MHDGFVDMHHHILFGMDDGPQTAAEMERMLDFAERDGLRTIVATPHAAPGLKPFDMAAYRARLELANRYIAQRGYAMEVLGGSEILYTHAAVRLLREGRIPAMNGTRFVLTECAGSARFEEIYDAIRNLANAGFIPILAHVERYRALWSKPRRLMEVKNAFEMRIQANCECILGRSGLFARGFIERLLEENLVDYIATDAHNLEQLAQRKGV